MRVCVITTIAHDASLVPHFLRHYQNLGVDSALIVIKQRASDSARELITRHLQPFGCFASAASLPVDPVGSEGDADETVRKLAIGALNLKKDDWILFADLDEFVQLPCAMPLLLERMRSQGADHVSGHLTDRLAADGSLREATGEPSIWDQFPLAADITNRVAGAHSKKVALSRALVELGPGHHDVRTGHEAYREHAVIHHFKWRAGIVAVLEERLKRYSREGIPWAAESARILRFIRENGRFDPAALKAVPGWRPPWN
jgi:hypothetical protein